MKRALLACLLCGVIGYAWGRHTTPARVEYRDRVQYRDRIVERAAAATSTAAATKTVVVTRWRERAPGGVERVVERVEGTDAAAKTETVRVEYRDRDVVRLQERVQLIDRTPRWSVGAVAGLSYDLRREYGGTASVRVLGPVEANVTITNRAALVGVAVRW